MPTKGGYQGKLTNLRDFFSNRLSRKGKNEMKKAMMYTLFVGISVILCASAIAKKEAGALDPPQEFVCEVSDISGDGVLDAMCFSWDPVTGADKYSIDIEVEVDSDDDGVNDMPVELSFGTGDRTDGEDPTVTKLCVPLTDLVFDIDENGEAEQLYGEFSAKVKALNPGKGRGRQNHRFSDTKPCGFTLTPPGSTIVE